MKARAVHKTQLFRVKGLRWSKVETTEDGKQEAKALVLGAVPGLEYVVWRKLAPNGWTVWRCHFQGTCFICTFGRGHPTAAAAKEEAERDWVRRLQEQVLAPAGQRGE